MTYRDFAPTSETERRMEALAEHARMIVAGKEPANPHDRFDDWTEDDMGYQPPSLN